MDWLKLFALLVAVATIQITADAPKKKIRIHLPQKVKHIYHHKKIYITNHPASSQYAPAFMPSAEGAVAVPTKMAVPAIANVLPLSSVELYDEPPKRMPGISPAAPKLLPLYRARGYYGPTPHEWDDQDQYDLAPPPEPTDGTYIPTAFSAPSAAPSAHPSKRVKIVKINEEPRKKSPRKIKSKRVLVRGKPGQAEEEHPVSTFHEHFYSDVDGSGTIRKIKKPQRVEKIIDGDTEHIHTYSEEHIHKLVFDDGTKLTGVVGIDPVGSMSALASAHPLIPIKNSQALLAIHSDALSGLSAVGSMGTPPHLEYAAYNPREVTHDHIFHDHGEIPSDLDITKEHYPPRGLYKSQSLRLGSNASKGLKNKYTNKYLKQAKPTQISEFAYIENLYSPYKYRTIQKPTIATPFEPASEQSIEDYRPVPHFKVKDKGNTKTRNVLPALYFGSGKQVSDYRLQQASASVQTPYSVSSTVVHDYKPKQYTGHTVETVGLNKFNKDFYNYPNNYEFDPFASSSNLYSPENPVFNFQGKKGKKKSISTQNISFGGLDHQTTVDHLQDSGVSATSNNAIIPSAIDTFNNYDQQTPLESAPSTAFTIRETSPVHPYYTAMATKALQGDHVSLAEASNDNYQYAEAPSPSTTPYEPTVATTTAPPQEYYNIQSGDTITTDATNNYESRPRNTPKDKNSDVLNTHKEHKPRYKILAFEQNEPHSSHDTEQYYKHSAEKSSATGKLKYGDKI